MELQEALLPQTYRAKRYVSKNLVNRRNKLYALQIEWSQMVTGDRLVVNSHELVDCRIGVVNKLDRRRRRRVLLTTRSTCRGEIFYVRIWDKVPERSALVFGVTQISL